MKKNVRLTMLAQSCMLLMPTAAVQAAQPSFPMENKALAVTEKGAQANKANTVRTITAVEEIQVNCPVGTAPRLPYQVWVTYSDGKGEFRQTKWSNAMPAATEKEEANPTLYPVGKAYTVEGFIIGDETTANGFPITAHVTVVNGTYNVPGAQPMAQTAPLKDVTVNGDNRLTHNREEAIEQILSWDVSQQLYNYRDTYGLSTEGYKEADGWDSPTTKLKGHGTGHYLSALALAYASATKPEQKAALLKNMRRMVKEMRECQELTFVYDKKLGRYREARDLAPEAELRELKGTWADFDRYKKDCKQYGYGYLNAIPAQHAALIEMYRAYNNSDWVWAPYYTIHKQLAGLIDIANLVDDKEIADKALLIAKDMGLWVWNRMHYRTYVKTDGTQDERRAKPGNRYEMWNTYIAGEVGGIGESLARLAEMVSNPDEKAKLIEASNCFDSPAMFKPLSQNVDDIRNRHANQHIPMIIAALRSYRTNQNPYYYNIAENFWELIQGRYRYATGGVGNVEMFRLPYTQILNMAMNGVTAQDPHSNPDINETCCAYNLAKLTKDLNCYNPDDARYMDYYERVLYNQLVGSLNNEHYGVTYQYAVGLNASKPFGNETPQSTCCGGTGSENHVKYQEATYFTSGNTLWVGLYMPTTFQWRDKGVTVEQDCLWPAEKSTLRIKQGGGQLTIKFRVPYWATEGFNILLNGEPVQTSYKPSSYVAITRNWTTNDVVEVVMPFTKHLDFGPDKLESTPPAEVKGELKSAWTGALMYGPLVMTGTGCDNWNDATLNLDTYLTTVVANGSSAAKTGDMGNLYTLTQNGKTFQPDYYRHENSTHYYRINYITDPSEELKKVLQAKLDEVKAYDAAHYTSGSYKSLKKAIKSSNALMTQKDVTEAEVTQQVTLLDKAVEALASKQMVKTALQNEVAQAKQLKQSDYTWDSYADLQHELQSANDLLQNADKQTAIDKQTALLQKAKQSVVANASVNRSSLTTAIATANERKAAQDKWMALEVKVPEYSPWAKHGYGRLMEQLHSANRILNNRDKCYNQQEVNAAAAQLNTAINAMRPGNLPELEDVYGLQRMLRRAKAMEEPHSAALKESIDYTEMVIKYVVDGSGTQDMIDNATKKMKAVLKE